ncbi:putative adhesin [Exilibacterium tricleocarpae]|uniref:putative adhesin n=1 Tax=Exilibacterium tricleocarpae TaxID=2591008 RepID=UPI003CCC49D8
MPRILVNCHGGRVVGPPANPPQFAVPAGVSIHFYVVDGLVLQDNNAWNILDHWLQRRPGNPNALVATFTPGQMCQDYYGVPYVGLGVAGGIQREAVGRGGQPYFETILTVGSGQNWGSPTPGTIQTRQVVLPAVQGGAPYARSVVTLSNIANCPGVTDVDWISCRQYW